MSCGCNINIYNTGSGSSGTYSATSLGAGEPIFAGEVVSGTDTEFQFKSIVAGANVTLTSDGDELTITSAGPDGGVTLLNNLGAGVQVGASISGSTLNLRSLVDGTGITLSQTSDSITINNSQVEVNSITNLGAGSGQILVDVNAGSVRARTITSTLGIDVNTSGNLVTIEDDSIQTLANVLTYNYGQVKSANLSAGYNSPSGVVSNTGFIMDYTSGNVISTGVDTIDYYPAPRLTEPAFYNFTTLAGNGSRSFGTVKLFPNTLFADDQIYDYFLAAGADGLLYQISPIEANENRMRNYNGSLVGLTNLQAIAMDIADNVLFYTQTTAPNNIRVYDFATGLDFALFTASTVSGWTVGSQVVYLTFNQHSKTLLVFGDAANSRVLAVNIRPFDRYTFTTFKYTQIVPYVAPYSAGGSVGFSCAVDDDFNFYISIRSLLGNSQVSLTNTLGSGTAGFISSNTPEANITPKRIVIGASGRLYVYSETGNAFYGANVGNSVGGGFALIKNLTRAYRSFTRTPYGILVLP